MNPTKVARSKLVRFTDLPNIGPAAARDFELSQKFYSALGFVMTEGWGGTADFELNGCAFRLQNYYVKDWADNFMFALAWRTLSLGTNEH